MAGFQRRTLGEKMVRQLQKPELPRNAHRPALQGVIEVIVLVQHSPVGGVSKAVVDCIAYGTPVEETIMGSTNILDFQLIAKTWQKCGRAGEANIPVTVDCFQRKPVLVVHHTMSGES